MERMAYVTGLLLPGWLVEADEGQDLIEYALLVGLIALLAMGAVATLGNNVVLVFWSAVAAVLPV